MEYFSLRQTVDFSQRTGTCNRQSIFSRELVLLTENVYFFTPRVLLPPVSTYSYLPCWIFLVELSFYDLPPSAQLFSSDISPAPLISYVLTTLLDVSGVKRFSSDKLCSLTGLSQIYLSITVLSVRNTECFAAKVFLSTEVVPGKISSIPFYVIPRKLLSHEKISIDHGHQINWHIPFYFWPYDTSISDMM